MSIRDYLDPVPTALISLGAILTLLGGIVAGIHQNRDSKKLEAKNEQLAQQGEEIARLSKQIVGSVTGGNSICLIQPIGEVATFAGVEGEFPLFEVNVRITDLEKFDEIMAAAAASHAPPNFLAADIATFALGELPAKGGVTLPPYFKLYGTKRRWNIFFSARNGFSTELLRMALVNGNWEIAIRVLRGDGKDVAFEKISKAYPREHDGSIKWN